MKKVLFLSFYWPPSGKASMHWPLKMIKYLPEYGWMPAALASKQDTFTAVDESMLSDIDLNVKVIKSNFWDPFILYKKFLGKNPDEPLVASEAISKTGKGLKHKLALWIRMNFFVPDARIGWYFPAVQAAKKFLQKNDVSAIISNGPPHTTHLIAKKLSKKYNIPLVTVFIDPWVDVATNQEFKRNWLIRKLDSRFEESVLMHAKQCVFVTKGMLEYFEKKYSFLKNKSNQLYWGYNEDDFTNLPQVQKGDGEIILHAGNIYDHQNPVNFWGSLKNEIDAGKNLKLKFVGTVSPAVMQSIQDAGLKAHTEYLGFLPYGKVIEEMSKADYLLACTHEPRHVPGKIFEYMRAGKPILAFGDDNQEVEEILQQTNSGMLLPSLDSGAAFFAQSKKFKTNFEIVKQFDRKNIAQKLAQILDGLK